MDFLADLLVGSLYGYLWVLIKHLNKLLIASWSFLEAFPKDKIFWPIFKTTQISRLILKELSMTSFFKFSHKKFTNNQKAPEKLIKKAPLSQYKRLKTANQNPIINLILKIHEKKEFKKKSCK